MFRTLKAECVVDCRDELGEGPLWCTRRRVLFWTDCVRKLVHSFMPGTGTLSERRLSAYIGSLALRADEGLLVALRTGLCFLDPRTGIETPVPAAAIDFQRERLNDGKIDRAGRFWVGTMDRQLRAPVGGLYVLDADLGITRKASGTIVSNGIAWSPDDRTMYFCDSATGLVRAYDYDLARAELANERVFIDLGPNALRPDGCTVDSNGGLWVAQPIAHRIACYDTAGKLCAAIDLPGVRPSSVMFGGDDLDILYITTMRLGSSANELARAPNAGSLFATMPGVRGIAEPQFAS